MTPPVSHLKGLDYAVVQQCMHCGLCLPTCPTYDATKVERHSPRGRIALLRALADDRMELTRTFAEEMYFCLGCLACMTACPAGVNYAELFEHARAEAESSGLLRSPRRNLIRAFAIRWLFMDLGRLRFVGRLLRLYQQLGLQTLVRRSGALRLLPRRLRELEALTPDIQPRFSAELIAPVTPALGPRRYRVALLTGCAQDLIFSDVNRDTAEVLARNGCEVITPPKQLCCGSLHAHNGEWALAQELARKQIEQFPPDQFDAIISNAGGCGSHLKHYHKLLAADPVYRDRAALWDRKVKDIHEWLMEIGVQPPARPAPLQVVTYHESCHLAHGQKITAQPRQLLRLIPNLRLVELPESTWCCGSAGIYNIVQPEMANQLLERKLRHIQSTGAAIVANGNSGCLLQLINGAKQKNLPVRVVHPVTLLAEAYRR
ncbi:MAG TPA: (Fe-S)-binding protein [Candidatus Paceibacterota bacterium]|nr:(Fe-S)-binding protein [Verrucomicrobiota bacterium]OQC27160.1 MAG: Lactate utilization protein A [Verrucomicrobia bacterium ADurb.Bin063]HRY57945.1 (Fe-S)-binding protein [Candidatus Paceibacterota bacterium]HNR69771.1 (Fe-S)-binding protein [Verrucomicrobiota bacterium]HNS68304.1 (Fe-S)-binding protein [Verrucomicrobiota bacterium]